MASLRRKAQQAAGSSPRDSPSDTLHDDQLDVDDMTSVAMFLLSRREAGTTIHDPEDLFPAYSMDDVYGIHSGKKTKLTHAEQPSSLYSTCAFAVPRPCGAPLKMLSRLLAMATWRSAALTKTSSMLGNHVGWKCGACSPAAQANMQLSEPFRAPLFQDRIFTEQRAAVDISRTNLTVLEAEFGLVLSKSLPPRGSPYTASDVMDAVSVIIPSVEVCASRWSGKAFEESTPFHRLADAGGNDSCLTGEAFEASGPEGVISLLDGVRVRFLIKNDASDAVGVESSGGSGADVLGHPANALAWLANSLIEGQTSTAASKYGGESVIGLQAGDFVMSGAAAVLPAAAVQPGDTVVAEFQGLGTVELLITGGETAGAESETEGAQRMSNEAWRELCAQARAPTPGGNPALELPMIYPWSPARETAVREALAVAADKAKL